MLNLSTDQKRQLLEAARHALEEGLEITDESYRQTTDDPVLNLKFPCFVTLLTSEGELRGCIGSLSTETSLFENAQTYALNAAQADPRFDPVGRTEVAELTVEMSVIGPMEILPNLSSLEIGRHGLCVRHGQQSGVLLAKVATEQGWDIPTFIHETCRKAGLDPDGVTEYEIFYFEEISFSEND